jgi:16S rRNA processing protein RimM
VGAAARRKEQSGRGGATREPESPADIERLVVGVVRGVHGLRGAVRIEVLTDEPEKRFGRGAVLHPEGAPDRLTVTRSGPSSPGWLVRFAELTDRNGAESLRGRYLEAEVSIAHADGPDTYYWHELIGAKVIDRAGKLLGNVVDVYRAGGAEVYIVRGEPYGEFDLPAVRSIVESFDPRGVGIVVDTDALGLEAAGAPRRVGAARRRKPRAGRPETP